MVSSAESTRRKMTVISFWPAVCAAQSKKTTSVQLSSFEAMLFTMTMGDTTPFATMYWLSIQSVFTDSETKRRARTVWTPSAMMSSFMSGSSKVNVMPVVRFVAVPRLLEHPGSLFR